MNRKSLFGRFAAPASANRPAQRPDYLRVNLEALEKRELLTVNNVWVDDDWFDFSAQITRGDGILQLGDTVYSNNQGTTGNGVNITKTYGTDAFGTVLDTVPTSLAGKALISDAIQGTTAGTSATPSNVTIMSGTYKESDIVIDRVLSMTGAGQTGVGRTLIVPEVASADVTGDFTAGTHSGIIINSPTASVQNLTLDGSGNGGVGTFQYHHGITTPYGAAGSTIGGLLHNPDITVATIDVNLLVKNVTVNNVYWHGITISAPDSTTVTGGNRVDNSTVANVGDTALNRDLNRVGILLQNQDSAEVAFSVVNTAGVGIASGIAGTGTFGSNTNARNKSGFFADSVANATVRGYSISFNDGTASLDFIVTPGSIVDEGMIDSFASNSVGANTSIGIYLNHSKTIVTGGVFTGSKFGASVQNTTLVGTIAPAFGGATFVGNGAAGSVGILAENSVAEPNSVTLQISGGTAIAGYQTGIQSDQSVAPLDSLPNTLSLERPSISSVVTGISAGNGAYVVGNVVTGTSLVASGTAILAPGFTNNGFPVSNTNPIVPLPATADLFSTGNVTLASTTNYTPLLTNQSGNTPLFDFNNAVSFYHGTGVPGSPSNNQVEHNAEDDNGWANAITQDGSGTLVVGTPAVNGNLGLAFETNGTPVPNFDPQNPLYDLHPVDISNRSNLNIVAKLGAGNVAPLFIVGLVVNRGSIELFSFPTSLLNTSTFTTVSVNLNALGIPLGSSDGQPPNTGDTIDMSTIVAVVLGGDLGLGTGIQNQAIRLIFDDISAGSIPASQLNVTGTVNLAGSNLNPTLGAGYTPTLGDKFTIVNNDGAEAVTGTFAGKAEGSFFTIGGASFRINYASGTGNDVVITRADPPVNVAPVLDLNGGVAGTGFTSTWTNAGAVNITDSVNASLTDDGTTLASLTATLASIHTGDVLSANTTGTAISASFSAGVLSLTGTDTVANYQHVLRTIKYNNTNGTPGVTSLTVNIKANDGALDSNTAVATINISLVNSTIPAGGRKLFYNNSGPNATRYDHADPAINAFDDAAIASDKTPYIAGSGAATFASISSYSKGINGIMVDISGTHAGDLNASDFTFKVGNNNAPLNWSAAPAPASIAIRAGAGVGGSDRVEITWADGAILSNAVNNKPWLEVIVKGNDALGASNLRTGLAASNVFFWGSSMGDTGLGDSPRFITNVTDELHARNNPKSLLNNIPITNIDDFNRDSRVDLADQLIARNNPTSNLNGTFTINVLGAGPFAPDAGPSASPQTSTGSDSAVASALTVAAITGGSNPTVPAWIATRLASVDLNGGVVAKVFNYLDHVHSTGALKILEAVDKVADTLGLDDDLLDSILETW